jgi:hypothetical protein
MASIVIAGDTSGTVTLAAPATAGTTTLTLPTTNGTVVVTGTTPTLNGITFPATQVPSADANTLDDYEEGTFTPSWAGNATAGTASGTFLGFYTKIGRFVQIRVRFEGCNLTGATGVLNITGLPFSLQQGQGACYIEGVTPTYSGAIPSGSGLMAEADSGSTARLRPSLSSAWDNFLMANSTFTSGGGSTYGNLTIVGYV